MHKLKPIPNFPGYYARDDGVIFATDRWIRHPRPMSPYPRPRGGYLIVNIFKNGGRKKVFVHVLVLETFRGKRPPGLHCRHLDGNPRNNRLENLVWGTPKENAADRERHGTNRGGRKLKSGGNLSYEIASLIRDACASGRTQKDVAQQFGVSKGYVSRIVGRHAWTHHVIHP